MKRFMVFVDGVCGFVDCYADSKDAARACACDALGLRCLPRRHVVVAV